jgi:hypothetical protein
MDSNPQHLIAQLAHALLELKCHFVLPVPPTSYGKILVSQVHAWEEENGYAMDGHSPIFWLELLSICLGSFI